LRYLQAVALGLILT